MSVRSVAATAVLVGGALGGASATVPVGDSDLYWHLATARETLARGIVHTDTFSWTAAGAPLATDQWAGQLVLYGAYLADGWIGVLTLRTLAVAVLVGLIAAAALTRRPRAPALALTVALPAIVLSRFLWTERPELLGAAFFAALVLLLELPGDRPLIAVAPLLVVWANVHGSFALGAVVVLLVGADGAIRDRARRRAYVVAIAGSLASVVLTPAGLGTLATPGIHLLDPPRQIQEWQIPDPTTAAGAIWAIVLGLVLASAVIAPPARPRDVLLVVPLAILSLTAIRHTPLFAIAATPYLVERLPVATGAITARVVGARGSPSEGAGAMPASVAVAFAAAGAMILAAGVALAPREPDETGFPVEALTLLPRGPGVFAQYDWGGWLIWRAPATPVFVDGRLVPYRTGVLLDYDAVLQARPGWREGLARRGVRWILVRPHDSVAVRALDLGWPTVARSSSFVLISVPAQ